MIIMRYNNQRYTGSGSDGSQYDYFDSIDNTENDDGTFYDDDFSDQEYHNNYHVDNKNTDRSEIKNRYPGSYQSEYSKHEKYSNSQPSGTGRSSGKKLLLSFLVILLFLNMFILAYIILDHTYALIGKGVGKVYPVRVSTTELVLTGKEINDFDGLEKLDKLQLLDLRGLNIDIEQFERIHSVIPSDCKVLWDVPISGHVFDSTSSVVSFSDATASELDSLKYFENLEKVNASGCKQYSKLKELAASRPDYDIIWTIPVGDNVYSSTLSEIKLTNDITPDQIEYLKFFPWLVYIDATEYSDYDTILKLSNEMPNCEINWLLNIAGISVNSYTSSIDLTGKYIDNLEDFKYKLSYLPRLNYINMCDCNLSNDQMADLCKTFPGKKFVWYVTFGNPEIKSWKVRTDITAFSTLNPSGGTPFTQEDFAPLFLYCTDLVAIDLGHNSLSDISLIANLKKLKFAILADNDITDVSPLATIDCLEYLEIFDNKLSDVSPLNRLEHLYDLDLTNNYITDVTQFFPMKNLLSLELDNSLSASWDVRNDVSEDDLIKLSAALPQCRIVRYHEDAYRYAKNNNRFLAMKLAFNNYENVIYFNDWDDIKFSSAFYN